MWPCMGSIYSLLFFVQRVFMNHVFNMVLVDVKLS